MFTQRCRHAALIFSFFATSLFAQSLTVTPKNSLPPGGSANLSYSNASLANQTIVVTISGGWPTPDTQTVTISLDGNGNGSASWSVPTNWRNASFNAPGCQQQDIPSG